MPCPPTPSCFPMVSRCPPFWPDLTHPLAPLLGPRNTPSHCRAPTCRAHESDVHVCVYNCGPWGPFPPKSASTLLRVTPANNSLIAEWCLWPPPQLWHRSLLGQQGNWKVYDTDMSLNTHILQVFMNLRAHTNTYTESGVVNWDTGVRGRSLNVLIRHISSHSTCC